LFSRVANHSSDIGAAPARAPTFGEALRVWIKIGLLSFGGPTGQIALMHQELVEKRRWISDARFLHALNYCMLLPGPEAQQLSVYIGWLLHRTWGGIVAGILFVLPGAGLLWAVSWIYATHGQLPAIEAVFSGLKPAVMAIVAAAVLRIGAKALKNAVMWSVAVAAFVAIYFLRLPFPLIIASAGLIGLVGGRLRPARFLVVSAHAGGSRGAGPVIDDQAAPHAHQAPSMSRTLQTAGIWLALWSLPVIVLHLALGSDHVLAIESLFFSKAAVVTFGGAYAVLPYVAQQAVETYGWLTAPQMLDGLGLAETTPGPLILVLQYVGFLGAWSNPEPFSPLTAATLGTVVTLWCTFVPSFLFVLTGAPYIEALRGQRLITSALSTVTAAVVGVVLNLAVWFALSVLVPEGGAIDLFALSVSLVAFVGLTKFNWGVVPVVLACGLLGWVSHGIR